MTKPENPVVVDVVETSSLSFDLWPGIVLTVKAIGPSSARQPTLSGGFESKAYLLFNGITKVGKLSPAAIKILGEPVPAACKVIKVDKEKNILLVEF
ncbi:MAG TPA: hypothetical protein VIG25_17480 [Pyrinomonadaceae bacterium]|jgi:hypothetical protein